MTIMNSGKSVFLASIKADLTTGGVGLDTSAVQITDTGLIGGGTAIDSFDASNSTNWTEGGDALNPSDMTGSADYKEGSGAMGLGWTFSSGEATYERTITSTDLSAKKLFLWFYISDTSALTNTSNAVRVQLGTGGFTDVNNYDAARSGLVGGWNSIPVDVDNPDSTAGSGATETAIDRIKVLFQETANVSIGLARFDELRYYGAGSLGVTDSQNTLVNSDGNFFVLTTHSVASTESNGLPLTVVCDTNGTTLLAKSLIPLLDKGSSTELQVDKYYYWE